ncbi:hypothetical protein GA0115240_14304 [Streptomyces sp. DvalAA-14]|uniref:hypothetical protein n=1 Tax=unclassified Streptomyces TaxID=2593676 RepID=UPI00081B79FC|nr:MULTISPECIES: hypothetical protein [unclassified Streptomyces]MYS22657.1 hypothetical protein [Streptomyces sp. SID4948]SCE20070.1 hypothetical protein GA0115240_14304 [Streptomyces sp. DvalAA-14]
MRVKAQHYAIVAVDVEKFGTRDNPTAFLLRKQLYALVESALDDAGIDRSAAPDPADRGDGFFQLLPGDVDKLDLTGPFVARLHNALRDHAATSNALGALRIRVVLHSGDVGWDGRGWVGEELNTACRLLDIEPLRTALAQARRAGLALAVTDDWYRRVVRHGTAEVEREAFREVPFDAKEIKGASAWIRVPGYDVPPGITPIRRAEPEAAGPASAGPAAPGGGAGGVGGHTIGDIGQVGQVVNGDLHVNRDFTIQMPHRTERGH